MSPDSKSKSAKSEAAKAKKIAKKGKADMARHAKKAESKPAEGAKEAKAEAAAPKLPEEAKPAKAAPYVPRIKPKLNDDQRSSLGTRRVKKAKNPRFRRHEWWRYVKLGGKHASWRVPSGIHSKVRRHFGYRPPLVSIGYRGPADVRGLHPSGFQEVLVHNVDDVQRLNKETQAARVGGTVGGRKAALIEKKADELGIRVLNRRG